METTAQFGKQVRHTVRVVVWDLAFDSLPRGIAESIREYIKWPVEDQISGSICVPISEQLEEMT